MRKKEIFKKIQIDLIDRPPDIIRMTIDQDELRELANSIQERGLLQPIGITPRAERYLIIWGDRRYLAHQLIGLKTIMCKIEDAEDDQIAIDRAMENIQRVNLTPLEEGHIYLGLNKQAGMDIEEISKQVGKSPGTVQRRIDILRMPDSFQKALHEKKVNISVAEELWACPDVAKREYFLELAIEHGITMAIARTWVQDFRKENRKQKVADELGGLSPMEYKDQKIYRACDICRGPVEYKNVKELRLCPGCLGAIQEAQQKE